MIKLTPSETNVLAIVGAEPRIADHMPQTYAKLRARLKSPEAGAMCDTIIEEHRMATDKEIHAQKLNDLKLQILANNPSGMFFPISEDTLGETLDKVGATKIDGGFLVGSFEVRQVDGEWRVRREFGRWRAARDLNHLLDTVYDMGIAAGTKCKVEQIKEVLEISDGD